jgi:hypothetical protein
MPGRAKSTPTKYEEEITICTLDEEQPNNLLDMIAWCGRQDTVLDQDEWILES